MKSRFFDHIDLRVTDLKTAEAFYSIVLPALDFPHRLPDPEIISFDSTRNHPKPEFITLIEDRSHSPNHTRIAFWRETKDDVDAFALLLPGCHARNIEGPMFCPEYSPTYYAVFFEDPCGNRLEVCCRTATPPQG